MKERVYPKWINGQFNAIQQEDYVVQYELLQKRRNSGENETGERNKGLEARTIERKPKSQMAKE